MVERVRKKVWLRRYRNCLDEVTSLEYLERERWQRAVGLSATVVDGMPKPPQSSNRSDFGLIKHLQVEEELEQKRDQANQIRCEISGQINLLTDPNQAQVLRYRYLNGYEWPEIQSLMNYSAGGLYNLHTKALDNLVIP